MNQHIAVIDCGTNTFTLSLFEITSSTQFKRINKERYFVELAEDGIGKIGLQAFERGLVAFRAFKKFLEDYPNTQAYAIGTAALRTASNGQDFIAAAYDVSGILIQLIDGDREADLIYKGVCMAAPLGTKPSLIIDIGGGSVEFIIANNQGFSWAKSYPIGNSVLFGKFHQSDPITIEEINNLENYLQETLDELLQQLKKQPIEYLIGASGTFDVLDSLISNKEENQLFKTIQVADFERIKQLLVESTYQQRLEIQRLSPTRAKLVVMSVSLIHFIIQQVQAKVLISSENALREGLVFEVLNS